VQAQKELVPMKQERLSAAFELIYEFRDGRFVPGAEISLNHLELLRLLSEDFFPSEKFDPDLLGELLPRLARTDSLWNKRTMALTDEFYVLKEAGKPEAAEKRRKEFVDACPSAWYRAIASSL
jgi:hypothetical protein